jgi:hypothetical protein
MKLRASHIIIAILLVIGGVFGYAVLAVRADNAPVASGEVPLSAEEAFLAKVRQEAETASPAMETGAQPPVGSQEGVSPDIEVETTHYDMGEIANDRIAKGEVMIYNKGTFDLTINHVDTTCGCTLGSVENKTIPAGGREPLIVTVNPARIAGFHSTKTLTISSNDPDEPRVTVDVTAKVKPEFVIEPEEIDFATVAKGETATKTAVVRQAVPEFAAPNTGAMASRLELDRVVAVGNREGLQVNLRPRPESEWTTPGLAEYLLEFTLDTTTLPAGTFQASYNMATNVARLRSYGGRVKANVTAPYTVKPRPVSIGAVQAGQGKGTTVVVEASEPVQVSDVGISGQLLHAQTQPSDNPNRAAISITVDPKAPQRVVRESLWFTVTVGDKSYTEKVPVTAVVGANVAAGGTVPAPPAPAPAAPAAAEPHDHSADAPAHAH